MHFCCYSVGVGGVVTQRMVRVFQGWLRTAQVVLQVLPGLLHTKPNW
jgi:hypothetical protein